MKNLSVAFASLLIVIVAACGGQKKTTTSAPAPAPAPEPAATSEGSAKTEVRAALTAQLSAVLCNLSLANRWSRRHRELEEPTAVRLPPVIVEWDRV
jgi:hypothetical protein